MVLSLERPLLFLLLFLGLVSHSCTSATAETHVISVDHVGDKAVYDCLLDTGVCSTLFTLSANGYDLELDFEEDGQTPRGVVVAMGDQTIRYCTWSGTCTSVGACESTYVRGVRMDKDSSNQIMGYYVGCEDGELLYCKGATATCTTIFSGLTTSYIWSNIELERDVSGATLALLAPRGDQAYRCPIVSAGSGDAADCVPIASGQTWIDARVITPYFAADGAVAGYLVSSNEKLYNCVAGSTTCEVFVDAWSKHTAIVVVEEDDGTPSKVLTTRYQTSPDNIVVIDFADPTQATGLGGSTLYNVHGLGVYTVTTSTTTTTPTGAVVRLLGVVSDATSTVYDCVYPDNTCNVIHSFTGYGRDIVVDIEEYGAEPRGYLVNADHNAAYCTIGGSCAVVHSCGTGITARGLDFDKDSTGTVVGFFVRCEDLNMYYCQGGACTAILSGLLAYPYGVVRAERDATGQTLALLFGDGDKAYRCPFSGGTANSADCEQIGGSTTLMDCRTVTAYRDANDTVKGYLVASAETNKLYRCWRGIPTCEEVASLSTVQTAASVVENVDGSALWFATSQYGGTPSAHFYDPSDYTNTGTVGTQSMMHGQDAYLVTTSTTTTTHPMVHVELMLGIYTDVRHCDFSSGTCADLTLGQGAHHLEIDFHRELWQPPRGVLIAGYNTQMSYCSMDGTCTEVGTCASTNGVRGVGLDKDANNEVLGYYFKCVDRSLKYCTTSGTCTEILVGLLNYAESRLSVERSATGETVALVLADGTEVKRCPVSGATADASECENIGGTDASAAYWDAEPFYKATGEAAGYIVCEYGSGQVLMCWRNLPACEVIATDVTGYLFDVGVVRNTDGTPLWFTVNRYDQQPSVLLIDANDFSTTADFSNDDGNPVMAANPYLVVVTTTTTTTTSTTTTSTTSSTSSTSTKTTTTTTSSSTTLTTTTSSTSTRSTTTTTTTTTTSTSSTTSTTSSTKTSTTTSMTTSTTTSTTSTSSSVTMSTTISTTTSTTTSSSTATEIASTARESTATTTSTMSATSSTTTSSSTVTLVTSDRPAGLTSTTTTSTSTSTSSSSTGTTEATSTLTTSSSHSVIEDVYTTDARSTTLLTTAGATTRFATTVAAAQVAIVYCKNDPSFTDSNGLVCDDWDGWDCNATDDMYNEEDMSAVVTACPVSCSMCPEGSVIIESSSSSSSSASTSASSSSASAASQVKTTSEVIFEESSRVSLDFAMDLNVSGTTEEEFLGGVQASVASALGVAQSYVVASLVTGSRRLLKTSATARALAGGVTVRCEIVVPPGSKTLSVVKAATQISEEGSNTSNLFKSSLSSSTGLDTSALSMSRSEIKTTVVKIAKTTDGTLIDVSESSTSTSTDGSDDAETGAVTLASGCEDEAYVDEQGYDCAAWVGYSCSSSAWLQGERPYSLVGLLEVKANCILSCGLCAPTDRSTTTELKQRCEDDEYAQNFCRRWRGMDCAEATNFSFSSKYSATLEKLCPLSCGTCDDQTEPAPCGDTPGFLDENNYACEDWEGFSCTSMYSGYTEEGMLRVQAYCQASCGFCQDSHKAVKSTMEIETCEDDPNFLLYGSFGCDYFVGKSCQYSDLFLETRWLLGPAASAEWHQALWKSCPVSCGVCTPQDKPSDADLFSECEDDPRLAAWCQSSWEGTNCQDWESSVQLGSQSSVDYFNATVFGRCPLSCGLCVAPSCPAGTWRNKRQHSCDACAPGEYAASSRSGQEAWNCSLSRPGFFVNSTGAREESLCDFGTYSEQDGASWCDDCPAGRFAGLRGASECEACSSGFFTSSSGESTCSRCPFGYWEDGVGSSSCKACPPSFTTLSLGSESPEDCVCPVGSYYDGKSEACLPCPPGFECFGGANTVDNMTGLDPTIMLMPGIMSRREAPLSAYKCIAEETNCPGHRRPGYDDDSDNPVCQGGSEGVRCGFCAPGSYMDLEEGCIECPSHSGFWNVARILVVLAILVYCLRRSYLATARDDFPPKVMFWMAIAFLQFMTAIEHLPINWPDMLVDVWNLCNIFNIFDFMSNFLSVNEECLFGDSVTILMVRDVVKPLAWPIVLFLPANILHRLATGTNFNWMIAVATIADALIAVFIQVSVMVVYAFPVEEMPNGKLFLSYHPRIEKGSSEWVTLLPLTALAVLVYIAGFLGFVAYGLWSLPRLMAEESEYRHLFAFFGDYRPTMYWWTGVLLAYEFFFALANAVFENPFIRTYLTIVLVITFALLEVAYKPGLTWETQNAGVAANLGMATLMAISTSMQSDDSVDMEDHKPVVATLTFFVILSIVVIVVVRLIHEFKLVLLHAEEKKLKNNTQLLVGCRNFMSQHLATDLKRGCLQGVAELDHCQVEIFVKFAALARVGLLRVPPEEQHATLHTFLDFFLSGHRLAYKRDSKFHRATTAALARNSRSTQLGWSSGGRSGGDVTLSQNLDVSSDSVDSSAGASFVWQDLDEFNGGIASRPLDTLPFRDVEFRLSSSRSI